MTQMLEVAGVSPATYKRWRKRMKLGKAPKEKAGPKKKESLNFEALREEIKTLRHGKKRTKGTKELQRRYQKQISRRKLQKLVREERENRKRKANRIEWKKVGTCWAIDATEYGRDESGKKMNAIMVKEMSSKLMMEPKVVITPSGAVVATHLEKLMKKHGAPLFLKRDNGSIFQSKEVESVLEKRGVIPLNNPPYYPRYNGAMERAILEVKREALPNLRSSVEQAQAYLEAVCNRINLKPRRSLGGRCSLEVFPLKASEKKWNRKERKVIFEWIKIRSMAILAKKEKPDRRSWSAAWRTATVAWLRCQDLIQVWMKDNKQWKVSPHFPPDSAHY
jgi:transposase InsO family protein